VVLELKGESRNEECWYGVTDGDEREDKDWDFGTGAGFYLTATSEAYKKHYNMYEHIVTEIPEALEKADLGIVSACLSSSVHFGD
jgi:S-formylglutathione hydrolase FrmB